MNKKLLYVLILFFFGSCAKVPENEDVIFSENNSQTEIEKPTIQSDVVKRLESPKPKGGENNLIIVKNDDDYGVNYFLEWDCDKRAQRWTAYRMFKDNSVKTVERSGDDAWHEDETIPDEYRSVPEDYKSSGFDRGHMCPSADRLQNKNMNRQTFCYSNMHPQYNVLNAGIWGDMEAKVRNWNRNEFRDTLYVVKGGTIDDKSQIFDFYTHGYSGLIIPKYFFMAVLCVKDDKYKAMGFWIEHRNSYSESEKKDLKQYAISIDDLEDLTGIDFYYNLDSQIQDEVEKQLQTSDWEF